MSLETNIVYPHIVRKNVQDRVRQKNTNVNIAMTPATNLEINHSTLFYYPNFY